MKRGEQVDVTRDTFTFAGKQWKYSVRVYAVKKEFNVETRIIEQGGLKTIFGSRDYYKVVNRVQSQDEIQPMVEEQFDNIAEDMEHRESARSIDLDISITGAE